MAYFIGLMLADGNVGSTGAISFVSLDQCLTEFIRDFVSITSPIRVEITKAGRSVYRWSVFSVKMRNRFAELGIFPRKSKTLRIPSIPAVFIWDFVRGVLDGDGHVDKARRASFSTGSHNFAKDLLSLFSSQGLSATLFVKRRSFDVMLNVSSSHRLASLMYNPGCPHLPRKRDRFL